jgi:DNA-binding NtrC family response regulator
MIMKPTILIVDDDETQRTMLKKMLVREGYDVETASGGRDALEKFRETSADVVVTDIKMPDMNGLELFYEINRLNQDTSVILMTAYGSIESAVQAMAEGASYYLTKPVEPNHLKVLIKKALESKNLLEENRQLREEVITKYGFGQIVGHSSKMQEIYVALKKVAESDATVLLLGETGTGKELAARAVHYNSNRKDHSFVKVSCASLPETLLESALFGHEKGAYTGADSRQIGMFEKADKGTIFLDEIGEINQNVQVKLLRFLQEKEFERVGGIQTIKVDARVIAATNTDLDKAVQELRIRKDLYYRLNVVQICMPPLRERREDILLLTEHFLEKHKDKGNGKIKSISPEVLSIFEQQDWPGNVREIENCIERAIVMGKGEMIQPSDLPAYMLSVCSPISSLSASDANSLEEVEKDLIIKALKKTGGNQVKAARSLGISRRTLQYRMGKYSISARNVKGEN